MIDQVDDVQPSSEEVAVLAELTEEITRRLESGEPVEDDWLVDNPTCAGPMRQLLPTLKSMVSLGEQIAGADAFEKPLTEEKKRPSS